MFILFRKQGMLYINTKDRSGGYMNGLLRVNSLSNGQLENEIESNHPLCSLDVKCGYFLFSDNIATINVPNEHYNHCFLSHLYLFVYILITYSIQSIIC